MCDGFCNQDVIAALLLYDVAWWYYSTFSFTSSSFDHHNAEFIMIIVILTTVIKIFVSLSSSSSQRSSLLSSLTYWVQLPFSWLQGVVLGLQIPIVSPAYIQVQNFINADDDDDSHHHHHCHVEWSRHSNPNCFSRIHQVQNFVQDDVYGRSCLYSNWKFLLIVKWSRYGKGILSQRWWSDCKDEKTLRFWRFQSQFFSEKAFLGPRRGVSETQVFCEMRLGVARCTRCSHLEKWW